nr:MAG TPA: protein of unknown function (DUF5491) [Caudoviricetes sp.]
MPVELNPCSPRSVSLRIDTILVFVISFLLHILNYLC